MKYTKIPTNTFQNLQMNAGILLDDFNPETGVIGNIFGATTGGINFTATPAFSDYGEDIDNAPKNVLELKRLDSVEATMSGTFATVSASLAKLLVGAADIDGTDSTHIIPRKDLETTDFKDVWWVGDKANGGFVAIHLINALSSEGFSLKTEKAGKGQTDVTLTGYVSLAEQNKVPMEFYSIDGEESE